MSRARPCVHDFKMVLTLLESFGYPIYLTVFIYYMNNKHPHYLKMIFQLLVLKDIESQYKQFKLQILKAISNQERFYEVSFLKTSFLHLIRDFGNKFQNQKGNILLKCKDSILIKPRYSWLIDEQHAMIVSKYVDNQEIIIFQLRLALFRLLEDSLEASPNEQSFRLNEYLTYLESLFSMVIKVNKGFNSDELLEDMLVLSRIINTLSDENIQRIMKIVGLMKKGNKNLVKYIYWELALSKFAKEKYKQSEEILEELNSLEEPQEREKKKMFSERLKLGQTTNFSFKVFSLLFMCNYHLNNLNKMNKTFANIKASQKLSSQSLIVLHLLEAIKFETLKQAKECYVEIQKAEEKCNKEPREIQSVLRDVIEGQKINLEQFREFE